MEAQAHQLDSDDCPDPRAKKPRASREFPLKGPRFFQNLLRVLARPVQGQVIRRQYAGFRRFIVRGEEPLGQADSRMHP